MRSTWNNRAEWQAIGGALLVVALFLALYALAVLLRP